MELTSLACNHCGAPLQVPETARFVTCNHCGAQLQVQRGDSAAWTEVVERLEQNQESVDRRLAAIEIENEIARLDRAWDRERESYQITTKDGGKRDPSTTGAAVGLAAVTLVGFVMIGGIASAGGGAIVFIPLLVIGAAVFGLMQSMAKAKQMAQGKQRYQRKRRELMSKLARLRSGVES